MPLISCLLAKDIIQTYRHDMTTDIYLLSGNLQLNISIKYLFLIFRFDKKNHTNDCKYEIEDGWPRSWEYAGPSVKQ